MEKWAGARSAGEPRTGPLNCGAYITSSKEIFSFLTYTQKVLAKSIPWLLCFGYNVNFHCLGQLEHQICKVHIAQVRHDFFLL